MDINNHIPHTPYLDSFIIKLKEAGLTEKQIKLVKEFIGQFALDAVHDRKIELEAWSIAGGPKV